jgi:hypothetical protein
VNPGFAREIFVELPHLFLPNDMPPRLVRMVSP